MYPEPKSNMKLLIRERLFHPFKTSRSSRNTRREEKKSNDKMREHTTIGGVYHEIHDGDTSPAFGKQGSLRSLSTVETKHSEASSSSSSSEDDPTCSSSASSWTSSGLPEHHKDAPRVARNAASSLEPVVTPSGEKVELEDFEILGRIMIRSRNLPRTNGIFASNHVLINNERRRRQIAPLRRKRALDELAREHAKKMAMERSLFHANPEDVLEELLRSTTCTSDEEFQPTRIGENVSRGPNVKDIHQLQMSKSISDKNNIIDSRFAAMGVGTAKADDGTLYLCQIFSD